MKDTNVNKDNTVKYIGVRIPFTQAEAEMFSTFMQKTDRKVGAYVKKAVLKAMEEETGKCLMNGC